MNGQEAVLKATTKNAKRLQQIYERYRATQHNPMLMSSVRICLIKLIKKGCVGRPSEAHYQATGKPYYSNKGANRPESIYIKAIRHNGGKAVSPITIQAYIARRAHAHNIRRKPDQAKKVEPGLLTVLAYLSKLKGQGRVTQDVEGNFGLPFNKKGNNP